MAQAGTDRRTTSTSSRSSPTTGCACASARPATRSCDAHHRGGRPPRRDLRELRAAARSLRRRDPRDGIPQIPRRVSGYNLDELLPENGFNVARALVGTEGTCVTVLEATVRLVPSPPARSLLVLGYPTSTRPATTCPRSWSSGRSGSKGIDDRLVDGHARRRALHPTTSDAAARRATAGCSSSSAATTKEEADAHGASDDGRRSSAADAPTMKLFDDPRRSEQDLEGPRVGPRRHGARPRRAGHLGGLGGLGGAAREARRLPARLPRAASTATATTATLYGHFGQGCVHTRIDFDLDTAGGHRDVPRLRRRRPPTSSSSLRRLALGRARRRPVARRAAAEDVRRRADARRSASSRRSGTRTAR